MENWRLTAAVLIAWIISVVLHEFAHGLVGYLGGDYTIKERGGLTLNPLQYVDPMMSILFPVVILLMGGIPLPGGATYVRRDLLRGTFWQSAVSLAGPAANFLLFLACALPLHPHFGWVNYKAGTGVWTHAQIFLATMALLQLMAVILNIIPVPPLDGFQAIAPLLPADLRRKLSTPPIASFAFFGYFALLFFTKAFLYIFIYTAVPLLRAMGFGKVEIGWIFNAYATWASS